MKRKMFVAGIILFILGLTFGALLGIHRLEASSPEREVSAGEEVPSVLWHEHWLATQGYVSSETGYQKIDISQGGSSPVVSGKISKGRDQQDAQVEVYPDMVVSKWKVHGHIHFR